MRVERLVRGDELLQRGAATHRLCTARHARTREITPAPIAGSQMAAATAAGSGRGTEDLKAGRARRRRVAARDAELCDGACGGAAGAAACAAAWRRGRVATAAMLCDELWSPPKWTRGGGRPRGTQQPHARACVSGGVVGARGGSGGAARPMQRATDIAYGHRCGGSAAPAPVPLAMPNSTSW